MRRPIVVCAALSLAALSLLPGAVSGQSPDAGSPAAGSPAAGGWVPTAITGTVKLSGWESSQAVGEALQATLDGFAAAYPNITVDYQPIPGDYVAAMSANFAARDVPDLFYVNADVAPEWI
jgi:multiple sugar transport system substrate-binding protein